MSETQNETPAVETTESATRVGPLHQAHADWLKANKGVDVTAEQVFAIYSTRKAFRSSDTYRNDLVGAKEAAKAEAEKAKAEAKAKREAERAEAKAKADAEKAEAKAKKEAEAKKKAEEKAAADKAKADAKAAKEAEAKAKATESGDKATKGGKAAKPTTEQATEASNAPF